MSIEKKPAESKKDDYTNYIKAELLAKGAVLVGFGDLSELSPKVRDNLPIGISIVVKYPNEVIQGIANLPTEEYNSWYNKLNDRLDKLVDYGAELLKKDGYTAVAMTRAYVGSGENSDTTTLPHKTVATRSGMGWIGKSALLVNPTYGSKIRLSSILTDAPLKTAVPINESKCGNCMICTDACPARAISGEEWHVKRYRDEFFDPIKCRKVARERAMQGFGGENTICGKCIEVCPYTRQDWV
jgi:epoxyqueuosine reductase QueG